MKILVVGDVHGCYYTFKRLVTRVWDPENQILVQVGDLINKGPHSVKCIKYWLKLKEKYPDKVTMLRGNHEQMLINFLEKDIENNFIKSWLPELAKSELSHSELKNWVCNLPMRWENESILITHAGINRISENPFDENSRQGVLYNRFPLKDVGKLQVSGHNIVNGNKPIFSPKENAWRIDTGVWAKRYLSALLLKEDGACIKVHVEKRARKDSR